MEIKEETRTVRYIEYDGKRFYEDGKGYWLGQEKRADGTYHRIRLHTYVWEKYNGPVPEGCDIHHIDHDPSNNELENLEAIPEHEHHRLHMAQRDTSVLTQILEDCARPKAAQWHRSDAGRAWHKRQYERSLAPKWEEQITLTCEYCGEQYQTSPLMASKSRFCSNKCKAAYRYHAGLDNVERVCPVCGKSFTVNKYAKTQTCSRACAATLASRSKTGARRRKP